MLNPPIVNQAALDLLRSWREEGSEDEQGLNSGIPIAATDRWWEQKRVKLFEQNSVQP